MYPLYTCQNSKNFLYNFPPKKNIFLLHPSLPHPSATVVLFSIYSQPYSPSHAKPICPHHSKPLLTSSSYLDLATTSTILHHCTSMDSASQQPVITSIPRATRIVAIFLILLSLAAILPPTSKPFLQNFALRPVATVGESKLWNIITAGFIEPTLHNAIINTVLFVTMGKWIENSWGPRLFIAFLFIVNISAAILTDALMLTIFVVTKTTFMYVHPSMIHPSIPPMLPICAAPI